MGYVLRVRLASFFTGAATASFGGLYILHRDYKLAHQSLTQQVQPKICYLFFQHSATIFILITSITIPISN